MPKAPAKRKYTRKPMVPEPIPQWIIVRDFHDVTISSVEGRNLFEGNETEALKELDGYKDLADGPMTLCRLVPVAKSSIVTEKL